MPAPAKASRSVLRVSRHLGDGDGGGGGNDRSLWSIGGVGGAPDWWVALSVPLRVQSSRTGGSSRNQDPWPARPDPVTRRTPTPPVSPCPKRCETVSRPWR